MSMNRGVGSVKTIEVISRFFIPIAFCLFLVFYIVYFFV